MIGASASLMLARVPFLGPIGAMRLGRIDGQFVTLPTAEEMEASDLDLVVASTARAVVMIEGFGLELPEPEMHGAILHAHHLNQEVIALQHDLIAALGLPPFEAPPAPVDPLREALYERIGQELRELKQIHGKAERNNAVKELLARITAEFCPEGHTGEPTPLQVKSAFTGVEERVVRELILDGKRPDGRGPKDLRPISCEVGLLPRAHGSALFQRGETQALVTTVLGTAADEQRIDGIMDEYSKKFMLDYNMPPFAVGEIRPIRGPGRREIGHGALAERSVAPIVPDPSQFPYTIRVISDILESNGSSSMASGRHRHPARPEEPGDHRGHHQGDAGPGPRGPHRDPPHDAAIDQAAEGRNLGERAPADPDPDQSREDRPGDRSGGQDDPPPPGGDRGQDRHRGQRDRHDLEP
jgi:polyribonucleotide nucleotidyltransferase